MVQKVKHKISDLRVVEIPFGHFLSLILCLHRENDKVTVCPLSLFYLKTGLSREHLLEGLKFSVFQDQTVFLQLLLISQPVLLHQ